MGTWVRYQYSDNASKKRDLIEMLGYDFKQAVRKDEFKHFCKDEDYSLSVTIVN